MKRDVFQGLADPTRRQIISLLAQNKSLNLNAIAEEFEISRPAISKHIKILEECELVDIQQKGRQRLCEINVEKLSKVSDWVNKHTALWDQRLDTLETQLRSEQPNREE